MVNKMIFRSTIAAASTAIGLFALQGCQAHEGSEKQLKEDVDSFATHYFNWHFPKAAKYSTADSEPWLRYAASNVHDADIDLLRSKAEDATIEVGEVEFGDDQTSATVTIRVNNYLRMDTIGQEAHLVESASFHLPMEMERGQWKVKLSGLPTAEKD